MSRLLACLIVGVAIWVPAGPAAGASACDVDLTCTGEVSSDDELDAIVGRGGLLLPPSYTGGQSGRIAAATCVGCEWQIRSSCVNGAEENGCVGATLGCPPGELRMRVMRRVAPATEWVYVGTVCVGDGSRPVPVAEVGQRVRDRFVDLLPPPRPSYQPGSGALVNLPAVFDSGQDEGVDREEFRLFSMPVHVEARPSWFWDFGDGATERTTESGGRYPDTSVSHTYTRAGERTVTVEASWTGTFTVDGLGPFAVTGGPVTQQETLDVVVRESGARLTTPS